MSDGFDAGTYGRSFAEVYDDWYPDDEGTAAAVRAIVLLATGDGDSGADPGRRPRVLELGVGTGRLALPLAAAGLDVTGLDSSPEMLDLLAAKLGDDGQADRGTVRAVRGDVARPDDWPDGPFDVVVAACNLVCNLPDAAAQAGCLATAADRLRPGGHLVVEAFVPAPLEPGRHLEVKEVRADALVLIATDTDADSGVVTAQHVELRDGEPVRLRPWRIRVVRPDELDAWADAGGLRLVARHADWDGSPFDAEGAAQVSTYRRPTDPSSDGARLGGGTG